MASQDFTPIPPNRVVSVIYVDGPFDGHTINSNDPVNETGVNECIGIYGLNKGLPLGQKVGQMAPGIFDEIAEKGIEDFFKSHGPVDSHIYQVIERVEEATSIRVTLKHLGISKRDV